MKHRLAGFNACVKRESVRPMSLLGCDLCAECHQIGHDLWVLKCQFAYVNEVFTWHHKDVHGLPGLSIVERDAMLRRSD
jgi:hypothetical protein